MTNITIDRTKNLLYVNGKVIENFKISNIVENVLIITGDRILTLDDISDDVAQVKQHEVIWKNPDKKGYSKSGVYATDDENLINRVRPECLSTFTIQTWKWFKTVEIDFIGVPTASMWSQFSRERILLKETKPFELKTNTYEIRYIKF